MKIETMTLTDFLLARIAEDERFIRREDANPHPADRARVLRECEAKQRMATWLNDWQADVRDEGLRILAAVYVDHPDYSPKWRP